MEILIDRIGVVRFLQIAIEGWNEIFLLILIAVMMIGINKDKTDEFVKMVKIPLTYELILFLQRFLFTIFPTWSACALTVYQRQRHITANGSLHLDITQREHFRHFCFCR